MHVEMINRNNPGVIFFILVIFGLVPCFSLARPAENNLPLYKALKSFQEAKQKERQIKADLSVAEEKRRAIGSHRVEKFKQLNRIGESPVGKKLFQTRLDINKKVSERDQYIPTKIPEELARRQKKSDEFYWDNLSRKSEIGPYWKQFLKERQELQQKIADFHKHRLQKLKKLSEEIRTLEQQRELLQEQLVLNQQRLIQEIEGLGKAWRDAFEQSMPLEQQAEQAEQAVYSAFVIYIDEMKKMPPPFLKSVIISDGTQELYHVQWTTDSIRSKNTADPNILHVRQQYLREYISELKKEISAIDTELKANSSERVTMTLESMVMTNQMIRMGEDYGDALVNKVLAITSIEIANVIAETALTGGVSTLIRKATDLSDKLTGKLQKEVREQAANEIAEKSLKIAREKARKLSKSDVYDAAYSKLGANYLMKIGGDDIEGKFGLSPVNKESTSIIVGDVIENALLISKDHLQEHWKPKPEIIGKWSRFKSGAQSLKGTLNYKSFKAAIVKKENLFALAGTAAKVVAAKYFEGKAEDAINEFYSLDSKLIILHKLIRGSIIVDAEIQKKKQRLMEELVNANLALMAMNSPRISKSITETAVTDKGRPLKLLLEFSSHIITLPRVSVGGVKIEMVPESADEYTKKWSGQIDVAKLPNNLKQAKIVVALGAGSKPYRSLDKNPQTPAYLLPAKDMTWAEIMNQKQWKNYETGSDINHRIALDLKEPVDDQEPKIAIDMSNSRKNNFSCPKWHYLSGVFYFDSTEGDKSVKKLACSELNIPGYTLLKRDDESKQILHMNRTRGTGWYYLSPGQAIISARYSNADYSIEDFYYSTPVLVHNNKNCTVRFAKHQSIPMKGHGSGWYTCKEGSFVTGAYYKDDDPQGSDDSVEQIRCSHFYPECE